MGDRGNFAKGSACGPEFFFHPADLGNIFQSNMAKDLLVGTPAGQGEAGLGQCFNSRYD